MACILRERAKRVSQSQPLYLSVCVRISFAGIDFFLISSWEKLTVKCITTTCAKHFPWWWPVINGVSLLNFRFAFGASGWEFGSNLPWIIWVKRHFKCCCPADFLLASGTPVEWLNSGEKRKILMYSSELKSFNSLIQAAVSVILTE